MTQVSNSSTIKGLVLRESLLSGGIPEDITQFLVTSYPHNLEGGPRVEVLMLQVPSSKLGNVCLQLSEQMQNLGFYCHFVEPDKLTVIFPGVTCLVPINDAVTIARTRQIGRMFNIPDSQMPFEKMFEVDHPND